MPFDTRSASRLVGAKRQTDPLIWLQKPNPVYVIDGMVIDTPLLLDTCVYIDQLEGYLPEEVEDFIERHHANHSTICLTELTVGLGRLCPQHPDTAEAQASIEEMVDYMSDRPHRLMNPSVRTAGTAGMLLGVAKRHKNDTSDHIGLQNDAKLYLHAMEYGWTILTHNTNDFLLFQNIIPSGKVIYYQKLKTPRK